MMVGLKRISTALGLLAAMASSASGPGGPPPIRTRSTADAVAGTLRVEPEPGGLSDRDRGSRRPGDA